MRAFGIEYYREHGVCIFQYIGTYVFNKEFTQAQCKKFDSVARNCFHQFFWLYVLGRYQDINAKTKRLMPAAETNKSKNCGSKGTLDSRGFIIKKAKELSYSLISMASVF